MLLMVLLLVLLLVLGNGGSARGRGSVGVVAAAVPNAVADAAVGVVAFTDRHR